MAEISFFPFVRRLRSEASAHVQLFKGGQRVASGRGLAFWFMPDGASIAEAPMDDRDLPFLFNSRSRDFQEITVQGMIVWRVCDAEQVTNRIDFSVDLRTGRHQGQPLDQVATLLTGLAQQGAAQYVASLSVAELLAAGVAPMQTAIEAGMRGAARLSGMGLGLVALQVSDISPSSELKRALQTPTFEQLQQRADEAVFARRALAVEKERSIAENELANQIELARRQKQLIAQQDENGRASAMAAAATQRIAAVGEAERVRVIDAAQVEGEKARMQVYAALPPGVMMSLAARELAGKLTTIEHLNITPDMLSTLLQDALGRAASPAPPAA